MSKTSPTNEAPKLPRTVPTGKGVIYACEECEYTATTIADLRRHSRFHTERNPLLCDICTASFTNKTSLAVHRRVHNREPTDRNNPNIHFLSAAELDEIVERRMSEKEERMSGQHGMIFRCPDCDYFTPNKQSFKHHRNRHTGEKPYKCRVEGCTAKFERPNLLAKHMRWHEEERMNADIFKCTTCDFKSHRECDLAAHVCRGRTPLYQLRVDPTAPEFAEVKRRTGRVRKATFKVSAKEDLSAYETTAVLNGEAYDIKRGRPGYKDKTAPPVEADSPEVTDEVEVNREIAEAAEEMQPDSNIDIGVDGYPVPDLPIEVAQEVLPPPAPRPSSRESNSSKGTKGTKASKPRKRAVKPSLRESPVTESDEDVEEGAFLSTIFF
eukprot:m.367064 g.367064  ORF g.367064 m.367064 type:complete len:382 (-) comp16662_c0_seq6:40-1185(-)